MTLAALPFRDPHARAAILRTLPDELYLETTNRCNLACRTCPQYFGMEERAADLTAQRVERILAEFPSVRRVVLHGIGEPMLNRELPEIIAAVKRRSAHATFNSNGLLLRGRRLRDVITAGLDELRVSIDAATAGTYELVRGADGFGRIVQNLRDVRRAQEENGRPNPTVSLWITGLQSNVRELPALVRLAHDVGVGRVHVQRLVYSGRGLAVQDEALFRRAGGEERAAVRDAERVAAALGVALTGSGEAGAGDALGDGDAPPASYRDCRRPWTLMYITANGNVLPCCIAPFTGAPYGGLILGNVFSESAEAIWNGERYQAWRQAMQSGSPPAACRGCGAGWRL